MHWRIKYPSSYCYFSCVNKYCDECKLHPDKKPERIEIPDPWDKEYYQTNANLSTKKEEKE